MKLLQKYHKQTLSKETLKELEAINKTYNLKYPNNLRYAFKLMIVKNAIAQKKEIEEAFEMFRNSHLDMWDNLQFNERNQHFQIDFKVKKSKMNSFTYKNETIYIPVFDILMNNLYDRETPVLELPQFYKLYQDFKSQMIDIDTYGLLPYQAHMCDYPCTAHNGNTVILYDHILKIFYRINDQAVSFPLDIKSHLEIKDVEVLSEALINFQDADFLRIAKEMGFLNKKLMKKLKG